MAVDADGRDGEGQDTSILAQRGIVSHDGLADGAGEAVGGNLGKRDGSGWSEGERARWGGAL